MTTIYFVPRKYDGIIDTSYHIKASEREYANIADYQVGDEIRILFQAPEYLVKAINEGMWSDVHVQGNDVFIPFELVKRVHAMNWHELGTLRELTHSIYVKVMSGAWEDVFLAVAKGEVPEWAECFYEELKEEKE